MSNDNNNNNNNDYKCQHGGPGELDMIEKRPFVVTVQANIDQIHKALLFKATHQEILAAEQLVLEQLITKHFHTNNMVDPTLMRLYFAMATTDLLKSQVEEARIKARVGIYLAMYLKHGQQLWEMMNAPEQIQMMTLKDMHTAIGLISSDQGLAKVLNQQIPCDCLEKALPNLNNNNKETTQTTTKAASATTSAAVVDKVLPNLKQRSGTISSA